MKKHFIRFMVTAVVVLLAACSKPIITNIRFEKPVSISISFAVYKANNYASKIYDGASAKLSVTIIKVRGNKSSIVWQMDYDARLLKQYPSLPNALCQRVVVNNVDDRKEHLEVIYTLTYDSNGSIMRVEDGTTILKGEKEGKLMINI